MTDVALASMTGYARAEGVDEAASWLWEVKSVNGRGLEMRCRLGGGLDRLEPMVRERVSAALARGSVSVSLRVVRDAAQRSVVVHRDLVRRVLEATADVAGEAGGRPSLDAVLGIPGVVEVREAEEDEGARDRLDSALLDGLGRALADLATARREEGNRIHVLLEAHLDEIAALVSGAAGVAATQPRALQAKLTERLAELETAANVSEERLAQEVALLAAKADVREELDRLEAHVAAARALLREGGAVGRRLDFLAQELSREANTLGSKSADLDLTRLSLALKAVIDRVREQAQNVE